MTGAQRLMLRALIDRRRRELLADEQDDGRVCGGCGADYGSRTVGCRACTDRARSRVRRMGASFQAPSRAGQCKGSTYYGSRCQNTATDGEFCYAHRQVTA